MAEKQSSGSTSLLEALYSFAQSVESVFVSFEEFADYLHKYAAKHVGEDSNMLKYLNMSDETLRIDLAGLETLNNIHIINKASGRVIIAVLAYYSVQFRKTYQEILRDRTIPFPSVDILPKQIPAASFQRHDAKEFILNSLEGSIDFDEKSRKVYALSFPDNLTPILYPLSTDIMTLVKGSIFKISDLIKQEQFHDYFLKKLKATNPNKEISTRNFYDNLAMTGEFIENIFEDEDSFYNWGQLCYFIKDDVGKISEHSPSDTSILQALYIGQIWSLHLKDVKLQEKQRDEAKKSIEQCFKKPPYFFELEDIVKFKDDTGNNIYKALGKEGLQASLDKLTTESADNMLPQILTVTVDGGRRYYIHKSNVMPLIIRLANEAHTKVQSYLTDAWYKALLKNKRLPEMSDRRAFEQQLEKCVRHFSPLLYGLLRASFLPVLNIENQTNDVNNENIKFNIYMGSKLQPYSEILMLQNSYILNAAKQLLPFWYNIPIINIIFKIFFMPKVTEKTSEDAERMEQEKNANTNMQGNAKKLSDCAREVADELVPQGSNIERELNSYVDQWNKMLTKDVRQNLLNDVNSLIRDYLHSIKNTLKGGTFTLERIQSLANTLYKTPNMQKINGGDALYMYIQLYLLKLIMRG